MQAIAAMLRCDPGVGRQGTVQPVQARFADFDPAGTCWQLLAALDRLAQAVGIKAGKVAAGLAFEQQGPEAVHGGVSVGETGVRIGWG